MNSINDSFLDETKMKYAILLSPQIYLLIVVMIPFISANEDTEFIIKIGQIVIYLVAVLVIKLGSSVLPLPTQEKSNNIFCRITDSFIDNMCILIFSILYITIPTLMHIFSDDDDERKKKEYNYESAGVILALSVVLLICYFNVTKTICKEEKIESGYLLPAIGIIIMLTFVLIFTLNEVSENLLIMLYTKKVNYRCPDNCRK